MKYTLKANNEARQSIVKEYYIKIATVNFIYSFAFSFLIFSPLLFFDVFFIYLLVAFSSTLLIAVMLTIPALNIVKSSNESIIVSNDSFRYSFVDLNKPVRKKANGDIFEREEIEMSFDNITKIEINHFFKFLTVYGQMNYRSYSDFENNKVKRTYKMDSNENKWTIVPIFDEIEQFARFLSNKNSSPLVHIKFPIPQIFRKQKD